MFKTSLNLKRVHSLLETARELSNISHSENEWMRYETEQGICKGRNLKNIGRIAIQDAYLEEKTTLKVHKHEKEEELLVVYEGDLTIIMKSMSGGDKEVTIADRGVVIIPPDTAHIVSSIGGCKLIGITIPATIGYPN